MLDDIVRAIFKKNRPIGYFFGTIVVIASIVGILQALGSLRQFWLPLLFISGLGITILVGWDKYGIYRYRTRKFLRFLALIYVYVVVIYAWFLIENKLSNYIYIFTWAFIALVVVSTISFFLYERIKLRTEKFNILFFEFSDGGNEEIPKDRSITHSVQEGLRKRFKGTKVMITPVREVVIDKEMAVARGKNAGAAAVIYCIYSKRQTKIKLDLGFEVTKRPEHYQPLDLRTKILPMEELDTGHLEILIENDYANVTNFLIGLFEYSSRDFKAAINTFTSLIAEASNIADFSSIRTEIIFLYLGNSYNSLGDIVNSKSSFEQALSINPNNPKVIHNIGVIEYQAGNLENSINAFSKAISIDSQLYVAYRNRAFALMLQDNFQEAIMDLSIYIAANPLDSDALKLAALCHSNLDEHVEAIIKFRLAQKKSPHDLNIAFDLADEYIIIKKYFSAFITPIFHLYQITHWALIFGYIADTLAQLKYARLANLFYTIALIFDRKNSSLYFSRSAVRLNFGKLNSARVDLKKAIELDPKAAVHYFNLGNIYMQERDYDEAQKLYSEGIGLSPNYPDFYFNRAQAFYMLQKYDEVVQDCEAYLTLTNDNTKILGILGLSLLALSSFVPAIEYLGKVYDQVPSERNRSNLVSSHFAYIVHLIDLDGDSKEIIYHYKFAKNLEPTARLDRYYENKIIELMKSEL
jgi:tetratricopeptide (TPR) repeat protein